MKRVNVSEMEPLEKLANDFDVEVHGLKCDNQQCDWSDMSIPVDDYVRHVNTKCPQCGEIVLTSKDLIAVMTTVFSAANIKYRQKNA